MHAVKFKLFVKYVKFQNIWTLKLCESVPAISNLFQRGLGFLFWSPKGETWRAPVQINLINLLNQNANGGRYQIKCVLEGRYGTRLFLSKIENVPPWN